MADEISTKNVETTTAAVNNLNDAILNTSDSTNQLIKQAQKIASVTNRQFSPLLSSLDKLKRKIADNTRGFDDFETVLGRTERGVSNLGTAFTLAAFANNKQAMVALNTMHRYAEQMQETAKRARKLAVEIDAKTAILHDNMIVMAKNKKALDDLGISQEKLEDISKKLSGVKLDSDYAKLTETLTEDEKKVWDLVRANIVLAETTNTVNVELVKNIDDYKRAQEELVELKERTIDAAEAQMRVNIESRKMQGGMTALSASLEGIVKGKFFTQLRDLMSGATIVAGLALIAKGMSEIGDQALRVNQIALSLGDTSESSFGRFWESGAEAAKMARDLNDAAIRLGYSMDELNGVANKFMLGTKMDKEGRLSAAAIAAMTQETARFAKVAGIDTAEAADLMDKRITRFGMSASEAVSNMQEMRVTLMQMTAGMKGNMVDLGNMVKIIEEASEASQSYVVDTRLMTQALRGAVTQAQNLGAAQKQSQDIAKGLGKVLSSTPDYIKIPAGQALVNKLMGSPEEMNKIMLKLDKGTRKQVQTLIDGMKKGTIGQYSGTKALMALIGQTEAGIEAQMDQLNAVIGDGAEAAAIVKETFQIENDATAQAITTMIQEANKVKEMFKDEKIGFSVAIAKDAALFNESIEKAGDDKEKALKELMDKGAGKIQAENYLKVYELRKQKEKELRDLQDKTDAKSQARKLEIEKEIMGITKDQLIAVDRMMDPTKELISDIEKSTGKPLDIYAKLDKQTLENAGIKSAKDLGDKLGMDYDDNAEFLEKAFSGASKKTIAELRDNRIQASKMAEETRRQMEDISHFFADPIKGIESAVKVFGNWIGLFTPWGKIVSGALLTVAGVAALWKGGSWLVEKGTFNALVHYGAARGTGVAGGGTGGATGTARLPSGMPTWQKNLNKFTVAIDSVALAMNVVDEVTAKYDEQGNKIESAGWKWTKTIINTTAALSTLASGFVPLLRYLPTIGRFLPMMAAGLWSSIATFGPWIALGALLAYGTYRIIEAFKGAEEALKLKEEKKKEVSKGREQLKKTVMEEYGLDESAAERHMQAAEESKKGIVDYLESINVQRIGDRSSIPTTPPSVSTSIPSTAINMPEQKTPMSYYNQTTMTPKDPLRAKGVYVGDSVQLHISNFSDIFSEYNKKAGKLK